MVTTIHTSTLLGVDAVPVDVEVQTSRGGKPKYQIIGLGDNAVKESHNRVCTALAHAGFEVPDQILVNLAPADLKKEGSSFDLAIAVGVLAASGQLPKTPSAEHVWFGELSLGGELKAIRGAAACVAEAKRHHHQQVIVPLANVAEANLIKDITVHGFSSLLEVALFLREGLLPKLSIESPKQELQGSSQRFLSEVLGQDLAKRALIIAAAGGHNALMIGPPGCGKSMLAERFSALLPPLTPDELLECVKIHSIAGQPIDAILRGERPFRNPHYIISDAGLVGGGNPPRPGEITMAHNGVLFLDEFPEFKRSALEALRLPLERGSIIVARARHTVNLPAKFQLIAAMNPCPCGKLGIADPKTTCSCPRATVGWYLRKLSQPILDRIDLHVEMSAVSIGALARAPVKSGEADQHKIIQQISNVHTTQRARNGGPLNAHVAQETLKKVVSLHPDAVILLERAAERLGLSARGYTRMLRVARTIADLEGSQEVTPSQIAEAISFRGLERLKKYANSEV